MRGWGRGGDEDRGVEWRGKWWVKIWFDMRGLRGWGLGRLGLICWRTSILLCRFNLCPSPSGAAREECFWRSECNVSLLHSENYLEAGMLLSLMSGAESSWISQGKERDHWFFCFIIDILMFGLLLELLREQCTYSTSWYCHMRKEVHQHQSITPSMSTSSLIAGVYWTDHRSPNS